MITKYIFELDQSTPAGLLTLVDIFEFSDLIVEYRIDASEVYLYFIGY